MSDLRKPSGAFFALLGLLLCAWSLISQDRAPLTEANVNLYTGVAMLIFGGVLLFLALRRKA